MKVARALHDFRNFIKIEVEAKGHNICEIADTNSKALSPEFSAALEQSGPVNEKCASLDEVEQSDNSSWH